MQVLHTQIPQSLGNQLPAAAVEGGVDHMEGIRHLGNTFPVIDHGHDVFHEGVVRLLTHELNAPGGLGLVKGHGLHAGENVDLLQLPGDGVGVLGGQLRAVGPVDLVAVILLGVVAGGDVDARLAAVVPHGEAQLRGGAQGLENAHMDAVGGADLRRGVGKLHTVVAAVHADGHALVHSGLPLGTDDVGEALGGPADDIDVHLMQAHLHGAPQAGGAELQGAVEPALDLLVIAGDGGQLRPLLLGDGVTVEPFLIFCFVVNHAVKSPFRFTMKVMNYSRQKWARRRAAPGPPPAGRRGHRGRLHSRRSR